MKHCYNILRKTLADAATERLDLLLGSLFLSRLYEIISPCE